MFAEYQQQVLLTYHEKKKANTLSPNLINTTPARLRNECILVFTERYDHHDDDKTLRQFFGQRSDAGEYLRAIRNFETDKFRPLDKLLKGQIAETHDKNIELLAWLIDFRPRPYQWDRNYAGLEKPHVSKPAQINPHQEESKKGNSDKHAETSADIAATTTAKADDHQHGHLIASSPDSETGAPVIKLSRKLPLRNAVVLSLLLCVSGGGLYWAGNQQKNREQCMCWTWDHYRSVSCREKIKGTEIFGMDSLQMLHFKKITRPDTLTQRSLGHVWYAKIDGVVEFYTAAGVHPVHRQRRLRPLTLYMLQKYARTPPEGIANN